jgi:uncharacterized protein
MPGQVTMRFYEELNDFLSNAQRRRDFAHSFRDSGSIKDLVESLGVPHTEIDLILVNGQSVDFGYQVQDGDRISVYPVFEALDIGPVTHLRPRPLREPRFVLDSHLGRLAAYLRLLGFDCLYRNDYGDPTLAEISVRERRILLTRDRRLLMLKQITRGYYVRAHLPQAQLAEVMTRFDLFAARHPFTRCLHCNGMLHPVAKEAVAERLQPRTRQYYDAFWQCDTCGKVYWKGSHYRRMQQLLAHVEAAHTKKGSEPF